MLSRIDDWSAYLSNAGDDEIGAHIAKHSRTGGPLGGKSFVQRLKRITGRGLSPRPPGRRKKAEEK